MPITLDDLTREELLDLCHRIYFIDKEIIRQVRYDSLIRQARKLADEAEKEMRAATGIPGKIGEFLKANDRFDEAMGLYREAEKVLRGE